MGHGVLLPYAKYSKNLLFDKESGSCWISANSQCAGPTRQEVINAGTSVAFKTLWGHQYMVAL